MQTPATTRIMAGLATLGVVYLGAVPALAQIERVRDPDWTISRTPEGQPDLQGIWGNKTITPIERRGGETRTHLTDEEMATFNQQRAVTQAEQDAAPARRYETGENVGGYGSYWLDSGDTVLSTGQTSFVVDPPSGRAPVQQWALDAKAYRLANEGDHYEHMSVWDRCISRGVPGSMLPAGYNNAYRIVQTSDHVAIYHEMIHDVRIIPLSGQPFVDGRIRQWMGDSRAHWDGDVLVVESRNFHNRGWIASSFAGGRLKGIPTSTALEVVERFERVSETTIMWTVTIEDANVYTAPWVIQMPLTAEPTYQMFEYACHEGNYAVPNALSGQRALDKTAMATEEQ
ncbi:MAG: hypothetical protein VYE68_15735 [Acidobacteriota bacterium]|nr:hypothetical protein [Acidobacteriota bacterium]